MPRIPSQFILPGRFVDHVATLDDCELATLAREAPFAFLTGDDRRITLAAPLVPRLRAAARDMAGHTFRTGDNDGYLAARVAVRALTATT